MPTQTTTPKLSTVERLLEEVDEWSGRVAKVFKGPADAGKFKGLVRMSLNKFRQPQDGDLILGLLRKAQREPIARPVDARKLARKPLYHVEKRKGKATLETVVSVPGGDEAVIPSEHPASPEVISGPTHAEIQHQLLSLGAEMGLDLWVARNDRSRDWKGTRLGAFDGMLDELPTQFNEATNRTIELIDVLWLLMRMTMWRVGHRTRL